MSRDTSLAMTVYLPSLLVQRISSPYHTTSIGTDVTRTRTSYEYICNIASSPSFPQLFIVPYTVQVRQSSNKQITANSHNPCIILYEYPPAQIICLFNNRSPWILTDKFLVSSSIGESPPIRSLQKTVKSHSIIQ